MEPLFPLVLKTQQTDVQTRTFHEGIPLTLERMIGVYYQTLTTE